MSTKMNILKSALLYKCPQCGQSDLFVKPFNISKPVEMPDVCPICAQKFEPEPGFYYGAMFLSYIMTAFVFLGLVGLCIMVFKMSVNTSMAVVIIFAIATYLFWLRFARSLWLHLVVRYYNKPNN